MNVDEIVKLILAISFAISLLGISFQLMRLISKFTDTLEDARGSVQSLSKLSSEVVDDYSMVKTEIMSLISGIKNIKNDVVIPIIKVAGLVGSVGAFVGRKKGDDKSDNEKEPSEELDD